MSKSQWKSEAEYQAACYRWYQSYVHEDEWGRLIGIYNNPPNIAQLISMGLRPGISDFLYFAPLQKFSHKIDNETFIKYERGETVWIELKILGRKQNDAQITWERRVHSFGHRYHLCVEELSAFQDIIHHYRTLK